MEWLAKNSSAEARVLIVAPCAGSLSEILLGPVWPHRLPDHRFHWSQSGLTSLLERFGFALERSFYPAKLLSVEMVLRHLAIKLGNQTLAALCSHAPKISFWFNVGEQGVVFRRQGVA